MIDTSKAKWMVYPEEKQAILWLDDHGFSGELTKQHSSKTVFTVSKDGITTTLEVPSKGRGSVLKCMETFEQNFAILAENIRLKSMLGK